MIKLDKSLCFLINSFILKIYLVIFQLKTVNRTLNWLLWHCLFWDIWHIWETLWFWLAFRKCINLLDAIHHVFSPTTRTESWIAYFIFGQIISIYTCSRVVYLMKDMELNPYYTWRWHLSKSIHNEKMSTFCSGNGKLHF